MNEQMENYEETSTSQELANMGRKAVGVVGDVGNLALGMGKRMKGKKDNDGKNDADKKNDEQGTSNNPNSLPKKDSLNNSNEDIKNIGKKAAKTGGKIAKEGAKLVGKGLKKLWALIPFPWNLIILGFIIIVILVLAIVMFSDDGTNNASAYAQTVEGSFLCNMVDPTDNHYEITSTYPYGWRIHPIKGNVQFHNAVDIGGVRGENVKAVQSGTIKTVVSGITREGNCSDGYGCGNYIIIDHGDGYTSTYCHLQKVNVTEGQSVSQGEVIGLLGSTGCSTGPHLHFGLRHDGELFSPAPFFGYLEDGYEYCSNSNSTPSVADTQRCVRANRTYISQEEFKQMCIETNNEEGELENLMKFQNYFEGGTSSKYQCTVGGEDGYKVYDDGLGYATTAYGFTWMRIGVLVNKCSNLKSVFTSESDFYVGKCIPVSVFEDLVSCNVSYASENINRYFKNACGYEVEFNSYEMDALIDFYHSGDSYTIQAAKYYCNSGEEAMLDYMSNLSLGYSAILKRRSCEVNLYKTGDYTCNGMIQ